MVRARVSAANGWKRVRRAIIGGMMTVTFASVGYADPAPVAVTVTANAVGGGYKYDYRVKNTGDKKIFSFMVGTPGSGAITPQIKECWGPQGWKGQIMLLPKLGYAATWVCPDQNSGIAPASELGGFGFIANAGSGKATFTAMADNAPAQYEGETTGPVIAEGSNIETISETQRLDCQTR